MRSSVRVQDGGIVEAVSVFVEVGMIDICCLMTMVIVKILDSFDGEYTRDG